MVVEQKNFKADTAWIWSLATEATSDPYLFFLLKHLLNFEKKNLRTVIVNVLRVCLIIRVGEPERRCLSSGGARANIKGVRLLCGCVGFFHVGANMVKI